MKYGRNPESELVSPRKRKLKTKPLIILIGILFAFNVFWFIGWLIPDKTTQVDEEVATVAGEPIMREQWMTAMEKEVGRDVLLELVNNKVMEAAAEQYEIDVTDKEIDLELALIRSVDGQSYSGLDIKKMRKMIRSNLILEKVLTKDVVVKDKAIQSHYDENTSLYHILPSYRTSVIIVPSKSDAKQTKEELSQGSSFEVLAKERSSDLSSASLGGDIGYINESTDTIDKAIVSAAASTKEGKNSDILSLDDGTYAIIRVNEMIEGQSFKFDEVKNHIKRELALEQLPQSVSPEAFWKEFDAKWFYGK
ncbi:peptidyl-prolyl cis-trans isomerase [Filibacter tadaridae]|uniref:peptidylprolyl isomerase n=1 Tax=Filibacter tadaridae TaxID=2483811 RepID=A0A3P5WH93_9BACL|nr:peptidyl-prolyl cis-trans isomerase [Filibacter tadaridae]VDC18872.1 Foldase protein PrsA 2 precursor [Filibacter tadaridae]